MNKKARPKAIVVHAGRRDSYQLARSFEEQGVLEKLINDLYPPSPLRELLNFAFESIGEKFPPFDRRHIYTDLKAFLYFILYKIQKRPLWQRKKDRVLSLRAGMMANKLQVTLFAYSYYAYDAFKAFPHLKNKLLFQLHPHPRSVRALLQEELHLTAQGYNSLMHEHELNLEYGEYLKLCAEPELADVVFTASSYTAKTLIENGIQKDRICICPYGVNSHAFQPKQRFEKNPDKLKVLFIGSFTQRKGLSYLFKALEKFSKKLIEVHLCGRGYFDRKLLQSYSGRNLIVHRNLRRDRMLDLMHNCHLFVLPSITEGFGHVILEAMSTGLPVITTEHTCGVDVIENGVEGYIIPIRDSQAIHEKLAEYLGQKSLIQEMGLNAILRAQQFTWKRFRETVYAKYCEMLNC